MKISALLSRQKGRDFYDAVFLLSQTKPNYDYLSVKWNIRNTSELKDALLQTLEKTDIRKKSQDFEHLIMNKSTVNRVLLFKEFVEAL
jgi:predicted nucleotidyltransferase component of viral defense system